MSISNGVVNRGYEDPPVAESSLPSYAEATVKEVPESEKTESEIAPKKPDGDDEKPTHWPSIYLLTAVCFFCGVQFSIFFPTLWPFLNTVDPTASETFFGFITAAFSVGQGIASPAFGYWMNRTKSIRQPLVFGTVVMIISNVIFCFVEAFNPPSSRRWVMMVARFFIGLGAGTVGVMRAYASTASNIRDRARAITFVQASYVLGMTIGPGIQVAFTPIGYPGWVIGTWFHLDMYTAPAWFASLINVFSLLFIFIFLEESYAGVTESDENDDPYFAMPKFDVIAVVVCVYTQFTLMFIITNLETVGSMYAMMMWGWTNEQTVEYTGILQAANGAFSLIFYGGFAWTLGVYVSNGRERIFTILGLGLGVIFHVVTFPWPFLTTPIPEAGIYTNKKGKVEDIGCNRTNYHWCDSTPDVNWWLYASFYAVVLAACFPIVNISMNTLFSKVLGSRRQGTMQGIVLMAGSAARTVGPLLVSFLFQKEGPIPLWYIEIGVLVSCMLCWIVFWRHLVPLDPDPKLQPYEYYNYDKGRKYRI